MNSIERHATNLADVVYGNEALRFDDPSENWFEATKIYRGSMAWDAPGVAGLLRSQTLQKIATHASKRFDDLPLISLPKPLNTNISLDDVIKRRRSADYFSGGSVSLEQLSTVLQKSYGLVERKEGPRRPIPSGGALYPLDLFIVANKVDSLDKGVYHFDPYRKGLTKMGDYSEKEFEKIMLQEESVQDFAFAVVISANFWRSRFKYGHRSYRFVFMEAGHVMQNMILLSTAQKINSRPFGGFIDDELMELIGGFNGVDDAPIYTLIAGT
ncbi:SagB/ThcOx family dehydrogenase [Bacillus pumilus]|uniref:SagB/ThcOx family dehydrogenase n=1 Tax=Bacillus pumilus TaxID=1408 RepID=UPI000B443D07|nr:SagB/ThcOx family dehydrogenase [Bacillus pumilus]OUZ10751.1 dehydrogenase [Bacillus pumilus]